MSGSSHLGVTDNQKRWVVAGIALNKILVPQIRPFVEQEIDKEYNKLKATHNVHAQSSSGRLQRWPPRTFLKYENINGNDVHPKLPGGRYNYSLFDCRVMSHIDFARLYVENYMAKFNAFDDHCDASAVLLLLGGVPVFSTAVQAAAGDVRMARNDWAHCVFSKWDQAKFQQSFIEMEHLVRVIALPAADEGKLLGELKDWESKGTQLCMNSPVDPALLQLVQQELKSLQDDVDNLSVEFEQEKVKLQQELQNVDIILKEMNQRVQRLEDFQGDANQRIGNLESHTEQVENQMQNLQEDASQRFGNLESRTVQVEDQVQNLQGDASQRFGNLESRTVQVEDQVQNLQGDASQRFGNLESRTVQVEDQVQNLQEKIDESQLESASCQEPVNPEKLVELIRRDYKGAVLCPFPWCEDELQLKLSNIFTRLQIVSRIKERSKLTDNTFNMTDVFVPHEECKKPRVVLIEGNPGMGKTTYCQKLAYDWSVGEIPPKATFPKVEMLLLLKCRDMHMKTANIEEAIADQLLSQDAGKKEKENFFHFIRSYQSRILLVLDGLDELRQDLVQGFLPLIQGKVFSNTYLVLTARHEAGMKVRRYCDTLLEIVGYTHNDAESYIKRYFSSHEDQSLANKMIEKLKEDDKLRQLTINPLNTVLLCLLCEETRGMFPSNRTKLYDSLVSCALRRYFAKRGVSLDDDDPVERCADQLNQLGKMAFEALLKNQLYFCADKMKCHSTDFLQLCFLSREPSVSKIRPTPCYAFTHKTFQEYFAAFYLAHQMLTGGDKEKETLLSQLSPFDNWEVWEFLLTMIISKSSEVAVFLVSRLSAFCCQKSRGIIPDVELDVSICCDRSFDWVREIREWSGDENALNDVLLKTLDVIAECEDGKNELKDYQKAMVSSLATNFPIYKLQFHKARFRFVSVHSEYLKARRAPIDLRFFTDELLLETFEHFFRSRYKLVHLQLVCRRNNSFNFNPDCHLRVPPSGFKVLASFIQFGHLLTHLNLDNVAILDGGTQALAEGLEKNRTLTHLNLRLALIRDPGAIALGRALQTNCTLTHLSLPQNKISGVGVEALAKGLQTNRALLYLDLSENLGGYSAAVALAQALKSKCTLTFLDISQKSSMIRAFFSDSDQDYVELIGDLGASALAQALRSNFSLTHLNLCDNSISDSGAADIGEALQFNCTLTQLNLAQNKIDEAGGKALGKALQSNRTLAHLNLRFNFIGDSGADELAKALHSNGSRLTQLDLGFNQIGSAGLTAIAEALLSNTSLTRLSLIFSKVKPFDATALAKSLQSNRTLTHLDLSYSHIDDSGATLLAEALQYHNTTLVYINLESNDIGASGKDALKRVDRSDCVVEYGNQIDDRLYDLDHPPDLWIDAVV